MPATLATLVDRTRRFLRDNPDLDTITASVTSAATTLVVADTTKYAVSQKLELGYETMIVRSLASATQLTVKRAALGSTAATHASGDSVLKSPSYFFADYLDAINSSLDATFPLLYKEVVDESLSTSSNTFEYTVPNMPGTYDGDTTPIPFLAEIKFKWTGDYKFYPRNDWRVMRGSTPKLAFAYDKSPGTLRLRGYGPFPYLSATSDTLDAQFPKRAERFLCFAAADWLLMTGEASRVRHDSGVIDAREQATRTGSSSAAASAMLQRFQLHLANVAMPPLPRHVVPTFPGF